MPIIQAAELGEDFSQKAVPEGEWDLRITNTKYAASAAGNKGLTIFLRIEGASEYDPPDPVAWLGEPVPHTSEYKRYMRQIQALLKAVGWTGDFDMERDAQELIGKSFRFHLTQETDRRDGKTIVNRLALPR